MGNVPTGGCCGVMEFAEQDVNGGVHNSKKSLALAMSDGDNSIASTGRGRDGGEKMTYVEAREAREVSSSERHTRRYRRKPTSIMLEGLPDDQQQGGVLGTGSFSSISEAGASILSGGRRLDEAFGRVAPPTRSTDDFSTGSFTSNDDATDYAICRAMMHGNQNDESRYDPQAESRDDV